MAHTVRILTLSAIAIGALVVPPTTSSAASASDCGGVVFRDLDADGRRIERLEHDGRRDDAEIGVEDVQVRVVDIAGGVHDTVTGRSGEWTIALTAADYPIRVEFVVPDDHEAGRPGLDAGNTIQFVSTPEECDGRPLGNLGVYHVDEYCATRPEIAVTCYVIAGTPSYDSRPAIRAVSNDAVDNGNTEAASIDDWLTPSGRVLATHGEIGTVYGQAALRDGTIFAAAFTKRHTRSTSDLNPGGNPTVIYRIPAGGSAEVFATVDRTAVDPHGRADRPRADDDLLVMDDVFVTGIGDIEISPDEKTLFVVALGRRQLVELDAVSGRVTRRHVLDGRSLRRSDCAVTSTDPFGDLRAFGLGWRDNELLVGVVCSAESTATRGRPVQEEGDLGPGGGDHDQLVGYVYGFRNGVFTERLAWPLAGDRGQTHGNELVSNDAAWHPWVPSYPFDAEHEVVSYPQPAITDLVVDESGDLVIALGDRWAHQTAPDTVAPSWDGRPRQIIETISAGDLQRACRRAGGWVIEGAIDCEGGFGYGWEFFDGENYGWHAETALGSVTRLPGRAEVVATQMNPQTSDDTWRSGGLAWHSTDDGDYRTGVRLYDGRSADPISTFEKASGLGDLAVLCGGPGPSIGGSVWHDVNADGVRDPGDGPVVGAAVGLLDGDGDVISIDFSDEQGGYAFDDSNVPDGLVAGAEYVLSMGERNHRRGIGVLVGRGEFTGLVPTLDNVGDRDDLDSDGVPVDPGSNRPIGAVIAVRVGDDPATPEREAPIAHHYDFGLRDRYDLAVTTTAAPAMREAGIAAFRIEIRNEGSLPSGAIEVRVSLPPETSQRASGAGSMVPSSVSEGSVTWAFDENESIAPGDVRVIDMELRVNDPNLESITSSVAITRDSGRDEDSDPGLTWDEDDEDELTVDLFGIAGTIWVDVGEEDSARIERGAGGVIVYVLAEDGTRVGGTTTDETGRFLFHSVPAGTYRIAIPAAEFESDRPLRGSDQAVGGSSRSIERMLDRDSYVTTDGITLGAGEDRGSASVRLGVVRRPPTPLVDLIVLRLLMPLALLCIVALVFDRRRHLVGVTRAARRA